MAPNNHKMKNMNVDNFKVVISDHRFEDLEIEREILSKLNAKIVDCEEGGVNFFEESKDADAILTMYANIDKELISNLEKCKIIARYGIGVDNIDIETATEKGIYITNVPAYCLNEVSDHTLGLMLTSLRNIITYSNLVKSGEISMSGNPKNFGKLVRRLQNLTLGLIGFGKISRLVANKANAIGLDVITRDPYIEEETIEEYDVKLVEFDEILEKSDIISIHTPLTDETKHMFSEEEFKKMKPQALLVNTARGPVIDTKSLLIALKNGEIRGAALDVLEEIPTKEKSALLERDDVIITPHVAWYSEEATIERREKTATRVSEALKGETPQDIINDEILQSNYS